MDEAKTRQHDRRLYLRECDKKLYPKTVFGNCGKRLFRGCGEKVVE
jgi:hypothetical protein